MTQLTETEKQELYQLVDQIPPGEVHTARRFLEYLTSRQEDDEPYTAAQQERDVQAAADIESGKGISHEEMLGEFGLRFEWSVPT